MKDPTPWWDALAPADQALFLEHRNTSSLPSEVATRLYATGQPPLATLTGWTLGSAFTWPSRVQEFLRKKAGDEPD
ncbi:hypothetical protein [Plantactinospora sonchi]|uniref:Uncharacterized protein n=1 Tax=Plantactinospora sonchi TaxID=1544735 RepID=A0ABU7S589_9ACTN